jgi:hypothetical protein
MRRLAIIVFIFFAITTASLAGAQSYYTSLEVGIAMGGSQYFGDLNTDRSFNTIAPAGGVYARKHLNPYISVKGVFNFTQVGYDDKYNTSLFQKERNLNFTSNIFEVAAQAEFNFFSFVTGDQEHRFTPFLTGGIGAFYYDPYTTYKGVKYSLLPLGTEGQNVGFAKRRYTNISPCFPIGVGVKWWLKGGLNLTLEIADRLTMTDYLDDVSATYVGIDKFSKKPITAALQDRSVELAPGNPLGRSGKQRGNTSSYDQYMLGLISISWHFKTYRCPEFMRQDLIRVR